MMEPNDTPLVKLFQTSAVSTARFEKTSPNAPALSLQQMMRMDIDSVGNPADTPDKDSLARAKAAQQLRDAERLEGWKDTLGMSESGRALIESAEAAGISFILDRVPGMAGYFNAGTNTLAINPDISDAQGVVTMAHELRHAWQHHHGDWFRNVLPPHDQLLLMRALEADAEANAVRVCYELWLQGFSAPFESYKATPYGDIALAFAGQFAKDIEAMENGRAMRAAYVQWFAVERRRTAYDERIIPVMEEMLHVYADMAAEGSSFSCLTEKWLKTIGEMPTGGNYHELAEEKARSRNTSLRSITDGWFSGGVREDLQRRLQHMLEFLGPLSCSYPEASRDASHADAGMSPPGSVMDAPRYQPPRDQTPREKFF